MPRTRVRYPSPSSRLRKRTKTNAPAVIDTEATKAGQDLSQKYRKVKPANLAPVEKPPPQPRQSLDMRQSPSPKAAPTVIMVAPNVPVINAPSTITNALSTMGSPSETDEDYRSDASTKAGRESPYGRGSLEKAKAAVESTRYLAKKSAFWLSFVIISRFAITSLGIPPITTCWHSRRLGWQD